jgi:hypothetical protein
MIQFTAERLAAFNTTKTAANHDNSFFTHISA